MRALLVLLVLGGCSRAPLPRELPGSPGAPGGGEEADLRPTSARPWDLATAPPDLRSGRPDDVVVVMKSQLRGFYTSVNNSGSVAFEAGPGAAPLGLGGVRLRSGGGDGAEQGGRAQLLTGLYAGVALRDLTTLRYATYALPGSTAEAHLLPALSLQLDLDGDGVRDTAAVFEPVYVPEQAPVRRGEWQTWDVRAGRVWFTVATSTFCAVNCFPTLGEVLRAHPGAMLVDFATQPGLALSVGQRSGGIWAGFDGAVDALEIGVRGEARRYDLEPEALGCSEQGWVASERPLFQSQAECEAYHR